MKTKILLAIVMAAVLVGAYMLATQIKIVQKALQPFADAISGPPYLNGTTKETSYVTSGVTTSISETISTQTPVAPPVPATTTNNAQRKKETAPRVNGLRGASPPASIRPSYKKAKTVVSPKTSKTQIVKPKKESKIPQPIIKKKPVLKKQFPRTTQNK